MTDFRPKVVPVGEIKWKGIMPHPIRKLAWDKVFDIQDHVVSVVSSPTELFVEINEGYTSFQGLAIMATAIYLAMNDLETLLKTVTVADHFEKMHEQIYFPYAIGPDDVAAYLEKYIRNKVDSILSNDLRIQTVNPDFIIKHRDLVAQAKSRLEFTPLISCTITPWEKAKRLKKCDAMIRRMNKAVDSSERINLEIERLHTQSKTAIRIFTKISVVNPLGCDTGFHLTRNVVQRNSQTIEEYFTDFWARKDVKAWTQEILAITPPAPAEK